MTQHDDPAIGGEESHPAAGSATFFSRIGKWFRRDASSDAAGGMHGGGANLPLMRDVSQSNVIEPRSTFLRPWARQEQMLQKVNDSFVTLTDLMGTIRDNLEQQNRRQEELLRHMSHLPEVLQSIPESSRLHSETLRAISQQIEHQSGQQSKLADILDRIVEADVQQRSTLGALQERVDDLNETDQAIAENLGSVGQAMQAVSKNSHASAAVLEQMRDNLNSRDGELERILHKQGNRFTTMLAVAIFLSIAALVAVAVMGYLGYEALQRVR
jgi:DNA repair ATPase RecN